MKLRAPEHDLYLDFILRKFWGLGISGLGLLAKNLVACEQPNRRCTEDMNDLDSRVLREDTLSVTLNASSVISISGPS